MKKIPSILIAVLSLLEVVLVGDLAARYFGLVAHISTTSPQFLAFRLVLGIYESYVFQLAIILSAMFYLEYRLNKKAEVLFKKWVIFSGIIFGIIPILFHFGYFAFVRGTHFYYDDYTANKIVASNISDELFLSSNGNPMGIRLTYDIVFPEKYKYNIQNEVYLKHDGSFSKIYDLGLYGPPRVLPALTETNLYDKNLKYRFTVDFIPSSYKYLLVDSEGYKEWDSVGREYYNTENFYSRKNLGRCLSEDKSEIDAIISTPVDSKPFNFAIKTFDGKILANGFTKGRYNMAVFHDGAIKDGVKECPPEAYK